MPALSSQGNGDGTELTARQLEVAILDRDRVHRTFRRLTGSRLELLLAEARPGQAGAAAGQGELAAGDDAEPGTSDSPDGGTDQAS